MAGANSKAIGPAINLACPRSASQAPPSVNLRLPIPLRVLYASPQIRSLNRTIPELEKTIKTEGEKLPGHKNLKSIKGIGDINDFESESKLASYFGIVPRVRNSNETEHTGRITKRGTKLGRTTLVQCSLIAMRYSEYLQRFFIRIARRRGKGKAIFVPRAWHQRSMDPRPV